MSKKKLQYVSLPLQNNSNCGDYVDIANGISKNMVCAGFLDRVDDKGVCKGDSGGPLIIPSELDNSAIIYGVVSHGKARFLNNMLVLF